MNIPFSLGKTFFELITYDKDANSWLIHFTSDVIVNIEGFWRLLEKNQIVFVSMDHGHLFGLAAPVDLAKEMTSKLENIQLLEIKVEDEIGDLTLVFDDNFRMQIFIASTGYETYQVSSGKITYIGLGSGEIAIFEG
jgi:hypothetical protein